MRNQRKIPMQIINQKIWMLDQNYVKQIVDTQLSPEALLKVSPPSQLPMFSVDGLAVIEITGVMVKNADIMMQVFGGTSTRQVIQSIEMAISDATIKHLLISIDSPGGSVDGLSSLSDAVFNARKHKPITVQIDGLAASAGLLIASQATRIFAERTSFVGSIGTRASLIDASQAFEKEGIKLIQLTTGVHKAAGEFGSEITEEQIEQFQKEIDFFFNDFVNSIVRGRNITEKRVRAMADGRLFNPVEALELHLIDGIQSIDKTLSMISGEIKVQKRNRMRAALANLNINSV